MTPFFGKNNPDLNYQGRDFAFRLNRYGQPNNSVVTIAALFRDGFEFERHMRNIHMP